MSRIAKLKHEALAARIYREHANHPTFTKPKFVPPPLNAQIHTLIPKRKRSAPLITVEKEVFAEPERKKKKKVPLAARLRPEFADKEEEDELDNKPEAWAPPEILNHLKDKQIATNVHNVISSIKGKGEGRDKIIVWDHGASKLGKTSDANLFKWLVAYAAHECVRKRSKDDEVFEDGAEEP